MDRNTKVAIKKPGVKEEEKERPKVNKDFFDGVKKQKKAYKK
jgi:hypothetical protein